jgi:hypothetical protein
MKQYWYYIILGLGILGIGYLITIVGFALTHQ